MSSVRRSVAILSLALMSLSGCGQKDDLGKNLAIGVMPASPYIVGGSGESCADKKSSITSRSVPPFRFLFTNFTLQWSGLNPVTIYLIRVTVEGSNIKNRKHTVDFTDDEIVAILNSESATIDGTLDPNAPTTINTNDPNRRSNGGVVCGLHIGGIQLEDESRSFKPKVSIEVFGVEVDSDLNQTPVRQRISASAQYL